MIVLLYVMYVIKSVSLEFEIIVMNQANIEDQLVGYVT